MALQTHINDIMMKRLNAQKAQAAGAAGSATMAATTSTDVQQGGGRGPQYEAHISAMQSKLDAANDRCLSCTSGCAEAPEC